jgi:SHS2 domain-containing protein
LDAPVVFAIHNDALFESRARVPEEIYKIMELALVDLSVSLTPVHTKVDMLS